jgi:integrase/recombinase XerD
MQSEIIKASTGSVSAGNGGPLLPAIIAQAGDHAARRFIEFFTATIRNGNTRRAYAKAVSNFLAWCEGHRLTLPGIEPVHVAAYIEQLTRSKAAPPLSSTSPPSACCSTG